MIQRGAFVPQRSAAASESSLVQSEELFRLLVESAEDYAIFLLDPEGRVASWNLGAHRLKGYHADEIIGRHFSVFYPPEKIEAGLPETALATARSEGRFENEGWRVRRDGSRFWANVVITSLWSGGRLRGYSKITRDLTARRRAEEELRSGHEELEAAIARRTTELTRANEALRAEIDRRRSVEQDLRESELRLRALTELMPVGVYTCDAPSGVIRYFNREAARLWGREPAVGDTDQRFCGSLRLFEKNGAPLPHDRTPMAQVLAGGPPVRETRVVVERPDGTRITVQVSIDPITGEDGRLVGAINVFQDVTATDRLFEDLRERAEEVEKLMEVMPVGVWIARDPECRSITGNAAGYELLRMAPGSNLSASAPAPVTPFRVFSEGREIPPTDLPMQRAAAQGVEVRGVQETLVFDDGVEVQLFGSAAPLFDEAGRVRGAIGAFMNVTELHRLDRELRRKVDELAEADRRKNHFLAVLAHELRNPLAPIRTGLELLRLAENDRDSMRQTRAMIERQVAQMVRLIDDLLDVARISSDKLRLRTERIELAAAVSAAVESSKPQIEAAGHVLTVIQPEEAVMVEGDLARLAQAFANLLGNSARYTEPGGRIWVTVERREGEATVSVRDTGIGIASSDLPQLFEMFTQVESSRARSEGGLGIGLSLVRSLVELHGGSVEARSEGRGRGSEFVVRLPLLLEREEVPSVQDQSPAPAPARPRCRVLVADDNRDSAESLAILLELQGFEVRKAFDGQQAFETAREFRPDVALLDIGMPGVDGYQAARALRQEPWGRAMILVAVTGWGQDEDKRRAHEAGFDHHFVKPVKPADLERLLAEAGGEREP